MKALDTLDAELQCFLDGDDTPCGTRRSLREHPGRKRMLAATIVTRPEVTPETMREARIWRRHAKEKCGSVILSIMLSIFVKLLVEWLIHRWQNKHSDSDRAEWVALRSEACRFLKEG